eukprot:scaffold3074_cov280-Chaetoceros_neogracile.AAC.17
MIFLRASAIPNPQSHTPGIVYAEQTSCHGCHYQNALFDGIVSCEVVSGTRISVENTDESTSGPGPFSYLLPRPSCRDRYQPLPHVQCDLAVTIPHVKKCDLAVTLS